jgi:uncharacterized protein YceH (UPF0502 family)
VITLDLVEVRVLGCLLEKQLSTPQYYPLTLNSLTAACNQSSNREPVTSFAEYEVADALASLREKALVRVMHSTGNRAAKYRHVLDEMWGLDDAHRSVLAVLMLRGPQTLGELRARTERLATFDRLADVEEVLDLLSSRQEPLVRHLERQPGQKEARYAQLFSPVEIPAAGREWEAERPRPAGSPAGSLEVGAGPADLPGRVSALEADVTELRAEIDELRAELASLAELRHLLD